MNVLGKLWRGQYSLAAAFWGFYVLGWLAGIIVAGLLSFSSRRFGLHNLGFLLALFLLWLYWIFASVGVWQSARQSWASPIYLNRAAAFFCRAIVLIVTARILWGLINGGALTLMNIAAGRLEYDP